MRFEMTKRKRRILAGVGVAVGLLVLGFFTPYERRHYTCLQCRLGKKVETFWGIPRTTYRANECSRWYAEVYPDHEHDWKKSSCTYRRGGLMRSFSCGEAHGVFSIMPELQKAYLASCTEQEAEAWFALLESGVREDRQKAADLAFEAFERHLEQGREVSAPGREELTAVARLHRAAREGDAEAVRSLIAGGCDVDARDEDGLTALHVAAGRGQGEVVG
jgi:hypothetical protein